MNERPRFAGFNALKRSVTIAQVLTRYGLLQRLRQTGDQLTGACPLHQGHNPNQFRVSLAQDCWYCFGDCHAGGTIIDFVSRMERVGIREAGLLIQDWFSVRLDGSPADWQREVVRTADRDRRDRRDQNPDNQSELLDLDPSHPYLTARGLDPETIRGFGLGFCGRGWLAGWIGIPIQDVDGGLVAYAGRWPGIPPDGMPRYRMPRGFRKSLELFNAHRAAQEPADQPLVVVEGFFGVMRLWQLGIRRVVGLMGSSMSAAQAALLERLAPHRGYVWLLLDADPTGRKASEGIERRLRDRVKVRALSMPEGCPQPEELTADQCASLGLLGAEPRERSDAPEQHALAPAAAIDSGKDGYGST